MLCQKWDSNPRLENQTATWTQRLRPLGHPDLVMPPREQQLMVSNATSMLYGIYLKIKNSHIWNFSSLKSQIKTTAPFISIEKSCHKICLDIWSLRGGSRIQQRWPAEEDFAKFSKKKKKNTVMLKPHEVKNILVPGRGAVLAPYSLDPILFAIAIYFSKISWKSKNFRLTRGASLHPLISVTDYKFIIFSWNTLFSSLAYPKRY